MKELGFVWLGRDVWLQNQCLKPLHSPSKWLMPMATLNSWRTYASLVSLNSLNQKYLLSILLFTKLCNEGNKKWIRPTSCLWPNISYKKGTSCHVLLCTMVWWASWSYLMDCFPVCSNRKLPHTFSERVLGSQARSHLQSPLPYGLFWNAQKSPHHTAAAKGSCWRYWSPPESSYQVNGPRVAETGFAASNFFDLGSLSFIIHW